MNRKQKSLKRQKATHHKLRCKHLKGGDPREWRKHKNSLWYRLRVSRKKLKDLSSRAIQRYIDESKKNYSTGLLYCKKVSCRNFSKK